MLYDVTQSKPAGTAGCAGRAGAGRLGPAGEEAVAPELATDKQWLITLACVYSTTSHTPKIKLI